MTKIVPVLAIVALLSPLLAFATVSSNVTICHATGNGWTEITVNWSSVDGEGNGDHNRSSHQGGKDIIPPGFWDWNGRNWDTEGQAIYNNGCVVPPPPPVDMCPNLEGTQEEVPEGYEIVEDDCVLIPPPPVDVCPNLEGDQSEVPEGYELTEVGCTEIVVEPVDVCENIDGIQESTPEGYTNNDGQCVLDEEENNEENNEETNEGGGGGGSESSSGPSGGGGGYMFCDMVDFPVGDQFMCMDRASNTVVSKNTGGGSCAPIITQYLRRGDVNAQVGILQGFLKLPQTNVFDETTFDAVSAFQVQYHDDVISPWLPYGHEDTPSGWVYKTTKWKINNIVCPNSEAFPVLP